MRQCIAVIGHSHLAAIEAAHGLRSKSVVDITFVRLHSEEFKPPVIRSGRGAHVSAPLAEVLDRLCGSGAIIYLTIGGAYHSMFGLTRHPQPFALHTRWMDPDKGGQPVPFALMREAMAVRMAWGITVLRTIGEHLDGKFVQMQSPPPIDDDERLRKVPGVYGEKIEQYGLAPARTRYAFWRIQSELFEEATVQAGGKFLRCPSHTVDENGFLVRKAWRDPTHGNAWYGEQVLQQIEELHSLASV